MLKEHIIRRIEEIEDQEDFDYLLESYKNSLADKETIEEAITYMKRKFPQYDTDVQKRNSEIMKDILAGSADIDDLRV